MRTKTLLLASVLSAAGAATSFAQAVYSVNAVGYVNKTLVPGFQLIANPLNNTAANGNTVSNLFTAVPEGTTIYKYSGTAFSANGFEFGAWANPNQTLVPGEGAFVLIPAGTPNLTVTFVGEVMQGTLVNAIPQGLSIKSSMVPQTGLLQGALGFVPQDGDTIYQFNTALTPPRYETRAFEFGAWSQEPTIQVAESFFISSPAAKNWTRTFSVNQ